MLPILPYADFSAASSAVLSYLQELTGFELWMVSRADGEDWILLTQAQTNDTYHMPVGSTFSWTDTFCYQMVCEKAPRIAPQVCHADVYKDLPINQQMPIGAYIGIPLQQYDGSLFGTLCAIHPTPMPDAVSHELPIMELLGRLLSTILVKELKAQEDQRHAERLQAEALRDGLTGVYNRRGWDHFLDAEEDRCRRYGHPTCIIVVDLDGLKQVNDVQGHAAGDAFIINAAAALKAATRASDIVARIGGDEFAVLCVETPLKQIEVLTHRIKESLTEYGVKGSLGYAMRRSDQGLAQACMQADKAMYAAKQRRKLALVS